VLKFEGGGGENCLSAQGGKKQEPSFIRQKISGVSKKGGGSRTQGRKWQNPLGGGKRPDCNRRILGGTDSGLSKKLWKGGGHAWKEKSFQG